MSDLYAGIDNSEMKGEDAETVLETVAPDPATAARPDKKKIAQTARKKRNRERNAGHKACTSGRGGMWKLRCSLKFLTGQRCIHRANFKNENDS